MTKDSTPIADDRSMICFMAGMRTSQPSRPNLFSDTHFFARNSSNLVDLVSRASSLFLLSLVMSMTPGVSNFSRNQLHCSRLLINMYSTPICWQYVSSSLLKISLRVRVDSFPPIKVVAGNLNDRSISFSSVVFHEKEIVKRE